MDEDDDFSSGDGSVADYMAQAGGSYIDSQTAYDIADNGAVTDNGSTVTSAIPSWLAGVSALGGTAVQTALAAGQVANIINGKVAPGPANPAAPVVNGVVPPAPGFGYGGAILVMIGVGIVAVWFFFFRRKSA